MSTNINLLTHVDEAAIKQARKQKLVGFIAGMILIAVGAISLGIFMLIQGANLSGIKKEQLNVIDKLNKLEDQQVNLFIVNNRLENIDKIIKTRKNISVTIDGLMEKMPDGFSVSEIKVDAESASILGKSDSLAVIGELISTMTNMARNKDTIRSLTLVNLGIEGDESGGRYYYVSLKSDL